MTKYLPGLLCWYACKAKTRRKVIDHRKEFEVEKETKRILQLILETMKEQQITIRSLQGSVAPAARNFQDGIADRIERIARDLARRDCFTLEWNALADKGWATKESKTDEPPPW